MIITVGFVAVIIAAFLGVPLFAVVILAAMVGFLSTDAELWVIAVEIYRIADTPLLVSLPLFYFCRLHHGRGEYVGTSHELD